MLLSTFVKLDLLVYVQYVQLYWGNTLILNHHVRLNIIPLYILVGLMLVQMVVYQLQNYYD